jgi:hypothetical protein
MTSLFQSLIKSPVIRAQILATLRHLCTLGAGALGTWLLAHGADQSMEVSITQALVSAVMGLAAFGFAALDVHKVDAKVNAAIALAPNSPAETIAALKAGKI